MPLKDVPGPAFETVKRISGEMSRARDRDVSMKEVWALAAEALDRQWQQEKAEAGK